MVALFGLFSASLAALSWFNSQTGSGFTPCVLKSATGVPCFLCGGTRASIALAKGDPVSSFLLNPMVCLLWLALGVAVLLKVVAGYKIEVAPIPRRWLWLGILTLVAANWAFVITHL